MKLFDLMRAAMVGVGLGMGITGFQKGQYLLGSIVLFIAFLLFLGTHTGKFLKEKILTSIRRIV